MGQEKELYAIIGETKKVKVKDKVWEISACTISELPKLQRLMNEFEKVQIESDNITDDELFLDGKLFDVMAKIIKMGLIEKHPGINTETIKKSFSLSALPVIINIVMDLNDFLSGMKGIRQKL